MISCWSSPDVYFVLVGRWTDNEPGKIEWISWLDFSFVHESNKHSMLVSDSQNGFLAQ